MEAITEFQGKYRFLSNFWPVQVEYEGLKFPSVEHAYQAAKTDNLGLRLDIQRVAKPGQAKRLGQNVPLVPHWDTRKFLVMHELLQAKFSLWSDLASQLHDTGTAELVEGNTWHDNVWGNCTCWDPPHTGLRDRCEAPGENWLGRLLMVVREDLVP